METDMGGTYITEINPGVENQASKNNDPENQDSDNEEKQN
jgi:hypothetical protein